MSVTFYTPNSEAEGVNMHNAGAGHVLAVLGYDTEFLCGSAVAVEFGRRLLDAAMDCNGTDLGERLLRLAPVVAEAASRNEDIQWA